MKDPVYLIDGYGLIYRSYFAFFRNPLINADGRNTSAIFGFFRAFFQMKKQLSINRIAVVLDPKAPTFRHEMYPEYKANREKAPEDLHAQVPIIEELLKTLGVPCVSVDGYEADDVIATLAEQCRQEDIPCYIYSGDKDLLQLIGGSVKILHPQGLSEWGEADVEAKRGIRPDQIIDYLALAGDSSDNVPGVAGVGDKTAVKLLTEFNDLEAIYAKLDSIKSKSQRTKLEEGREAAFLSRRLVTLEKNVPLPEGITPLQPGPENAEAALKLFHSEGIRTFDGEWEDIKVSDPGKELSETKPGTYQSILTLEELDDWIARIRSEGVYAFDSETDSLDELSAHPIGFSLSTGKGLACYIPMVAAGKTCIDEDTIKGRLASLLEDSDLLMIGQNIKYDYKVLRRWGIEMKARFFDTMIAAWVLDSSNATYNMDRLALDFLRHRTISYTDLIPKGESRTLAEVDLDAVTDYAGEDADITYRLYEEMNPLLDDRELADVFYNLEMPNVKVLAEMELTGIHVSSSELEHFSGELETDLLSIEKKIFEDHGREFNIASTKQLQEVLFVERKLQPIKKTKTGYSTDAQSLEILAAEDTVCANILKHRTLSKLKSTYVDALPLLINPETGRIHTHFIQTGTSTGRISSKDPNLQNIPIREEIGRRIRSAFTAAEGYHFLSADYSQIEVVILAALSKDPLLEDAFRQAKDIHKQTAALLFGVSETDVTAEMRRIGKTINFGVIYGMSGFRLSRDLRIPRKEGDGFITRYFERYAGVDRFIKETIAHAEKIGYVSTISGRQRPLPSINSRNQTEKKAAERMAVNTVIQGSAADIVKTAMIRVSDALTAFESKLLLQVHDELIFEVQEDETNKIRALVKKEMEQASPLDLPLKVNIEEGERWGSIH